MNKLKTIFSKIKRISPLNAILILCFCVLLGSVSVLFGYALCNNGLIIASSKHSVSGYYLIEANCFSDYDEAVNFSTELRGQGGAGYIRFDNGYRVFLSGYLTEKDARTVCDKIEGEYSLKIYNLSIDEFDFDNGLGQSVNSVIKNNIISFKYAIENLNNVLIEFDKGSKDEVDVKNCCILILEELGQQIDKFMDYYTINSAMIKYKNYIHEFYDMFDKIVNLEVNGIEFSAIVRYQEIGCMFKLQDILNIV